MTPLELHDGTKIDTSTGLVISEQPEPETTLVIPSRTEAQEIVTSVKRKLIDLPAAPTECNTIGVIAFYTAFGMDDAEIAIAINTTVDTISVIKQGVVYTELMGKMMEGLMQAASEDTQSLLAQHSRMAAKAITDGLYSNNINVRMSAGKDILDRTGHRPADIVEHRIEDKRTLRIEVVEPQETRVPTLELEVDG